MLERLFSQFLVFTSSSVSSAVTLLGLYEAINLVSYVLFFTHPSLYSIKSITPHSTFPTTFLLTEQLICGVPTAEPSLCLFKYYFSYVYSATWAGLSYGPDGPGPRAPRLRGPRALGALAFILVVIDFLGFFSLFRKVHVNLIDYRTAPFSIS